MNPTALVPRRQRRDVVEPLVGLRLVNRVRSHGNTQDKQLLAARPTEAQPPISTLHRENGAALWAAILGLEGIPGT